MTRKSLKFLHLADLHLGRGFSGGRLKLPYEKARKRVREQRNILAMAVEQAREAAVDIILIAGDLWEESRLAQDTVAFVMDTLGAAGVPVVISPGNHDYHAPGSHYSDEITEITIKRRWPDNVFIVRDYDFTHFQPPGLEGVVITGIAYHSNQPDGKRRFGVELKPPEADIRICVVHGSRDDHLPAGKMITMPFSDAELLAQPFDYIALGHYHRSSMIRDEKGMVRAAYPGSACALAVDETGPHGCIIGTVHPGGVHPSEIALKPLDTRRIHRLMVDVSGLQHIEAVEAKISEELKLNKVGSQDMALVELTGTYPGGGRMEFAEPFINESCFHLQIDCSSVRPEWDIDDGGVGQPLTTEGIFRERMKRMIEEALGRNDTSEAARLQNALYYGLDALHNKPITPR
ncbi:MAG TPA: hypothetical protein ENL08_04100 [Bacteroidetes bacterium]|nr:hypothetical protein [Bacteroidota bacterium]